MVYGIKIGGKHFELDFFRLYTLQAGNIRKLIIFMWYMIKTYDTISIKKN